MLNTSHSIRRVAAVKRLAAHGIDGMRLTRGYIAVPSLARHRVKEEPEIAASSVVEALNAQIVADHEEPPKTQVKSEIVDVIDLQIDRVAVKVVDAPAARIGTCGRFRNDGAPTRNHGAIMPSKIMQPNAELGMNGQMGLPHR